MVTSLKESSGIFVAVWVCNKPQMKKKIFSSTLRNIYDSLDNWDPKCTYEEWKIDLQDEACNVLKNYPAGLLPLIPRHLFPLIGLQMLQWAEIQESQLGLTLEFCREFMSSSFFTPKGTIDEEKALRELVKESRLDTLDQYKIACYYFMADIIPLLWKKLRHKPDFKRIFLDHNSKLFSMSSECDKDRSSESFKTSSGNILLNDTFCLQIWTKYLEENETRVSSATSELNSVQTNFLTEAFNYGIETKNLSAVKYSWNTIGEFKRILKYEDHLTAKNEGFSHISVYEEDCDFWEFFPHSNNLLNFMEFQKSADIFLFFFRRMEKEEIKQFLIHFDIVSKVLEGLLFWPYQSLFLDVVDTGCLFLDTEDKDFGSFCSKFHSLILVVIKLIEDSDFGDTYDYRHLLSEFWIKSPTTFKENVIHKECSHYYNNNRIFVNLFSLSNFTLKDESNYILLLESVSLEDRRALFSVQGRRICFNSISNGNFSKANIFLNSMAMKEEAIKKFKKTFAYSYFYNVVMKKGQINKADEFVNWVVSEDEIENFKQEIFSKVFKLDEDEDEWIRHYFEVNLNSFIPFLNSLLKWFLITDCKLKEWKRSIVSNELFPESFVEVLMNREFPICLKRCDEFLEWIVSSEENVSDFKSEILFKSIPYVARRLFEITYKITEAIDRDFKSAILYLCSNEEERINEFIKVLRDTCNSYVEENVCLICQNEHRTAVIENKIVCNSKDHKEFNSEENLNSFFSYVENQLKDLLPKQLNNKKSKFRKRKPRQRIPGLLTLNENKKNRI